MMTDENDIETCKDYDYDGREEQEEKKEKALWNNEVRLKLWFVVLFCICVVTSLSSIVILFLHLDSFRVDNENLLFKIVARFGLLVAIFRVFGFALEDPWMILITSALYTLVLALMAILGLPMVVVAVFCVFHTIGMWGEIEICKRSLIRTIYGDQQALLNRKQNQ